MLEILYILWIGFILAFMSKVPIDASTCGSVLLAGVLLKLGTYGIFRYLISIFPLANIFYLPIIYVIGGFSIFYALATALRQTDLKRIIAYTEIAHMNLVVIAMFVVNHSNFTFI